MLRPDLALNVVKAKGRLKEARTLLSFRVQVYTHLGLPLHGLVRNLNGYTSRKRAKGVLEKKRGSGSFISDLSIGLYSDDSCPGR